MKKEYSAPNMIIESVFATDILTASVGIGLQNDDIVDYGEIFQ